MNTPAPKTLDALISEVMDVDAKSINYVTDERNDLDYPGKCFVNGAASQAAPSWGLLNNLSDLVKRNPAL